MIQFARLRDLCDPSRWPKDHKPELSASEYRGYKEAMREVLEELEAIEADAVVVPEWNE